MSAGVLPSANVSANVRAANAASAAASSTVPGRMCTASRCQSIGTSAGDRCSVANVARTSARRRSSIASHWRRAIVSRPARLRALGIGWSPSSDCEGAPQAALALDADRQPFERAEQRQVAALAAGGERQRRAAGLAGKPLDRQRRRAGLGEQARGRSRAPRGTRRTATRTGGLPGCRRGSAAAARRPGSRRRSRSGARAGRRPARRACRRGAAVARRRSLPAVGDRGHAETDDDRGAEHPGREIVRTHEASRL